MTGEQEIDPQLGPTLGQKVPPGTPKPRPVPRRVDNPPPFKPLGAPKLSLQERQRIERLRREKRLPLWCGPAHPAL